MRPTTSCLWIALAACGEGAAGIDAAPPAPDASTDPFSFFVTSLSTMRAQSGSEDGFGGDLGGLAGADQICQTAAAAVGFGHKTWRAFLSVTDDGNGNPVDAIDRVGPGPWHDRNGRLIAADLAGLAQTRPDGDPQTIDDLPDEGGVPLSMFGDTHDVLTGSDEDGRLMSTDPRTTCDDWTNAGEGFDHTTWAGHSWPAMSGRSWLRAHPIGGCLPGVNLIQNGPGSGGCVGCGGGWGAIYCLALAE